MFGKDKIIRMGKAQDKSAEAHVEIFEEARRIGTILGLPTGAVYKLDPLSFPPFVDVTFTGEAVSVSVKKDLKDVKPVIFFEVEYEYFSLTDDQLKAKAKQKLTKKETKKAASKGKQTLKESKVKGKKK